MLNVEFSELFIYNMSILSYLFLKVRARLQEYLPPFISQGDYLEYRQDHCFVNSIRSPTPKSFKVVIEMFVK